MKHQPCPDCWPKASATPYPTRCYRSDDEPKAGDVVRMRHDDETHHGVSPSFDDSLIVEITIDGGSGDRSVLLARPHAYLRLDGEIDVRVERHSVSLATLVERYQVLTTGREGKRENRVQPLSPAFEVLVPWSDTPTQWHPTEKEGPFKELVRGSFATLQQAAAWAVRHLAGTSYSIRYRDPMADPETRAEFEAHVGYPLDLEQRSRDAHASVVDVDALLLNAPSCTLVKGAR